MKNFFYTVTLINFLKLLFFIISLEPIFYIPLSNANQCIEDMEKIKPATDAIEMGEDTFQKYIEAFKNEDINKIENILKSQNLHINSFIKNKMFFHPMSPLMIAIGLDKMSLVKKLLKHEKIDLNLGYTLSSGKIFTNPLGGLLRKFKNNMDEKTTTDVFQTLKEFFGHKDINLNIEFNNGITLFDEAISAEIMGTNANSTTLFQYYDGIIDLFVKHPKFNPNIERVTSNYIEGPVWHRLLNSIDHQSVESLNKIIKDQRLNLNTRNVSKNSALSILLSDYLSFKYSLGKSINDKDESDRYIRLIKVTTDKINLLLNYSSTRLNTLNEIKHDEGFAYGTRELRVALFDPNPYTRTNQINEFTEINKALINIIFEHKNVNLTHLLIGALNLDRIPNSTRKYLFEKIISNERFKLSDLFEFKEISKNNINESLSFLEVIGETDVDYLNLLINFMNFDPTLKSSTYNSFVISRLISSQNGHFKLLDTILKLPKFNIQFLNTLNNSSSFFDREAASYLRHRYNVNHRDKQFNFSK